MDLEATNYDGKQLILHWIKNHMESGGGMGRGPMDSKSLKCQTKKERRQVKLNVLQVKLAFKL